MIDRKHIGMKVPPYRATVEKGQLLLFAKATGETNPIYLDEEAARAIGCPAIPIPPTFAFSLALLAPDRVSWADTLKLPMEKILHGEQAFEYLHPVYCGDALTFHERISDIYEKNDGALEFVVADTDVVNQHGTQCLRLRTVAVLVHAKGNA
ncbi:MAG: MaoC family dehydratase N-terminal domain-containing protein [Sulfuricaulis sp.]|nr:MaoC family dehydratase N-terminal domain-containing protein [Sulfuricaulis sp.]